MTALTSSVMAADGALSLLRDNLFKAINTNTAQNIAVNYRTHVQDIGWEPSWMSNGYTAGSQGLAKRLEGIEIKLDGNLPGGAGIEYRTHIQQVGWETQWATNGQKSGTEGRSLRLEGIQIRLVNMPGYSVQYRTHVQNLGWENNWAKNGEVAGTQGKGLRLEGIQIQIVKEAVDLSKYNEILDTVQNAVKEKYTAQSWSYLQATLLDFAVDESKNQLEIDAAVNAIENAYKKLIVKDTAVYYTRAGTYGPIIGTTKISENVVVSADGVVLRNLHISGDLIISETVDDGDVTLNNVVVDGDTFIRGGGVDSIRINGGSYSRITIQKTATGELRVVATSVNGLDVVIAESAQGDEIILEGSFDKVQIDAPEVRVIIPANTRISRLTVAVEADNCQISLAATAQIDRLIVNAKTALKGQGKIIRADVNADSVTYEKTPDRIEIGLNVKIPPIKVIEPIVSVSEIKVQSTADVTTIAVGTTVQMSAEVLPSNATNKQYRWSLVNAEGRATISAAGVFTARKTGPVIVEAAALDGSGVTGTKTLIIFDPGVPTISSNSDILFNVENQDFIVKLSNDTFVGSATDLNNWTINMGTTGLSITSMTRNNDQQVTVHTKGVAKAGVITLRAKATALTRGLESNALIIDVPVIHVTSITVSGANITTDNGKVQMMTSIAPADATNKTINWSIVKGEELAKIDKHGLLTGLKNGEVVVRGMAADNSGVYGEASIIITNQYETTISAAPSTIANGAVDPKLVISLTNDTFSTKTIAENLNNWVVSGTTGLRIDAITRDSDSQVTIQLKGTAQYGTLGLQTTEMVTVNGEASNQVAILVPPIPVESVSILSQKLELTAGQTLKLEATVLPVAASVKTLTWKSSDDVVASVDEKGLVTARYEGLAFITATSHDGKQSASCAVIVEASQEQNQAIVEAEARKYESSVVIEKTTPLNATVTAAVGKLISGNAARSNVTLTYKIIDKDNKAVTEGTYLRVDNDNKQVSLIKQKTSFGDATERVLITFEKEGKTAMKFVDVVIRTTTTVGSATLDKITATSVIPLAAKANQNALTKDGGVAGDHYTFRANAPLQSYDSTNPSQGSAKWVGFVIDTGLNQSIIGLSVDTGSGTYHDFTEADVTEALSIGASAGKFVFWMKADVAAERTIKIKNGTEIKTITVTVVDFAFETVVKNPDSVFKIPNDEVTTMTYQATDGKVILGGVIPYQTVAIGNRKAGSNLYALKISLKHLDKSKTALKEVTGTTTTYLADDLWKYDGNYCYYVGEVNALNDQTTLTFDYDGDWGTVNDQISLTISIASGTSILDPTLEQILKVIQPTITSTDTAVTVDYANLESAAPLSTKEKALLDGYYADAAIDLPAGVTGTFTVSAFSSSYNVILNGEARQLYLSEILGLSLGEANLIANQSGSFTVTFASSDLDSLNFAVQSVIRDQKTNETIIPYGSLVPVSYKK